MTDLNGHGATVVMVLHDLASACRYADHLIAMRDGQIVAQGAPADVVTPALVRALYQDADGWLWVGTEGRGLARFARRSVSRISLSAKLERR